MRSAVVLFLTLCVGYFQVEAQELPRKSPKAYTSQVFGLTEVAIDYSSPAMNGRRIFGSLVPLDQLWRTGANEVTRISFSTPVTIEGIPVNEGTYALFTIPGMQSWTLILNPDTTLWGTNGYDEKKNVLEVAIPIQASKVPYERMRFTFSSIQDSSMQVNLCWAETRISFTIQSELRELIERNVEDAIASDPENYNVYLKAAVAFKDLGSFERAMSYVSRSLEIYPDNWYAYYIQAELFELKMNCEEALRSAMTAMEKGLVEAETLEEDFKYEKMVMDKITLYRSKDCKEKLMEQEAIREKSREELRRSEEEEVVEPQPEKKKNKKNK